MSLESKKGSMSNMKSGLAEYRRKLKSGEIEPSANRTPREKMEDNPNSLRAAITCFCWECMGESRKEVSECEGIVGQDKKCPLWKVRPWQKNQEDEE